MRKSFLKKTTKTITFLKLGMCHRGFYASPQTLNPRKATIEKRGEFKKENEEKVELSGMKEGREEGSREGIGSKKKGVKKYESKLESKVYHTPVMVEKVVSLLSASSPPSGQPPIFLDATFGDGGHSIALLGQPPPFLPFF